MVRINLLSVKNLSDEHLRGEYNEILKLLGYIRKYPELEGIPMKFKLGKGHVKFFKNKLGYLENRWLDVYTEMRIRDYNAHIEKFYVLANQILKQNKPKGRFKWWLPSKRDKEILYSRITEKLLRKPNQWHYYGKNRKPEFFVNLMKQELEGY